MVAHLIWKVPCTPRASMCVRTQWMLECSIYSKIQPFHTTSTFKAPSSVTRTNVAARTGNFRYNIGWYTLGKFLQDISIHILCSQLGQFRLNNWAIIVLINLNCILRRHVYIGGVLWQLNWAYPLRLPSGGLVIERPGQLATSGTCLLYLTESVLACSSVPLSCIYFLRHFCTISASSNMCM